MSRRNKKSQAQSRRDKRRYQRSLQYTHFLNTAKDWTLPPGKTPSFIHAPKRPHGFVTEFTCIVCQSEFPLVEDLIFLHRDSGICFFNCSRWAMPPAPICTANANPVLEKSPASGESRTSHMTSAGG